ncbi:DUF2975 domain-containing protein [Denitrobaculum tricleocarpae]|nr:DUF2975 domain-containing protein [Denitrobaculum tricleocarpae]
MVRRELERLLMMMQETLSERVQATSRIRSWARGAEIVTFIGMAVIVWYCGDALYSLIFGSSEDEKLLTFVYSFLETNPEFAPVFEAGQPKYPPPEKYSLTARTVIFLSSNLINVLVLFALYWARELFRGYGRGEIFNEISAQRLGRVGWMITFLAPVGFISDYTLLKTILVAAAPGEAALTFGAPDLALIAYISVGELDAFAIVIGLLIVLVGRILSEASKISDENRSFI